MSVARHLDTTPDQYDVKIRTLIPLYDELVGEAARALGLAARPIKQLVDLGIGTGALTRACLDVVPRARVWGIDADASMMSMVPTRLGALRSRVALTTGDFARAELPACDAMVSTYALHHIREPRAKQALYRRCFAALRPGGVLINGDCAPASTPKAFAEDLEVWYRHLAATYGRSRGKRIYASWANEDFYLPLRDELRLLERAGFTVEVPWRRSPFAVIVASKPAA